MTIRTALISVSDKAGVVDFARGLAGLGVKILSTGGTRRALLEAGVEAVEVSAHTGFPEIMDGRVKTLHPRIHGGILARRGIDEAVLAEQQIETIDLVVVNLYPFRETIAQADVSRADCIEQIDIGGPAMIRAAAKNHAWVGVVTTPSDYPAITKELQQAGGKLSAGTLRRLAARAYAHTAAYDTAIANWMQQEDATTPDTLLLAADKVQDLRYGENPHQSAAFYRLSDTRGTVTGCRQLQGKELSFNNIADTDAALECVKQFSAPACVIVKHANPCGVAEGADLCDAYDKAHATDPTSAFGGILAFNRELTADVARAIVDRQFAEVIVAPGCSAEAVEIITAKKNLRLLDCETVDTASVQTAREVHTVAGGLLWQDVDRHRVSSSDLRVVSQRQPGEDELADLLFAWRVAHYVKSNAIVYAHGLRTVGVGAGQMSRVDSARIGILKAADAQLEIAGSVMASDAFFPFRDGIDAAAAAGVRAIIQPGGSMRDEEVIAAADEAGMAMVFTGIRHFRH